MDRSNNFKNFISSILHEYSPVQVAKRRDFRFAGYKITLFVDLLQHTLSQIEKVIYLWLLHIEKYHYVLHLNK